MKIAIFSYCFAPFEFGGGERSTKLLAQAFSRQGQNVLILSIAPDPSYEGFDIIDGLNTYRGKLDNIYYYPQCRPKVPRRLLWHLYNQFGLGDYSDVLKTLGKFNPDIILLSQLTGFSHILIRKIKRQFSTPCVYVGRDYLLIDPRTTCFRRGKVVINDFLQRFSTIGKRKSTRLLDWFVFNSKRTQEIHQDALPWISNKSSVIYTDSPVGKITERQFKNKPLIKAVMLGKVSEEKGILQAAKTILAGHGSNVLITVAGDGPQVAAIKRLCLANSRISYAGTVDEPNKAALLASSDILIQPSQWEEPYPRVILEAFMHSCLVIATKIGGNPELLGPNARGILYEPNNSSALTQSIKHALDNIPFSNICLRNARSYLHDSRREDSASHYTALFLNLLGRRTQI